MKLRLAGANEIAAAFGVSVQTVSGWKRYAKNFPAPLAELRMGPVYDMDAVLRWYAARRERKQRA